MVTNRWIYIIGGMCYSIYLVHHLVLTFAARILRGVSLPGGYLTTVIFLSAILLAPNPAEVVAAFAEALGRGRSEVDPAGGGDGDAGKDARQERAPGGGGSSRPARGGERRARRSPDATPNTTPETTPDGRHETSREESEGQGRRR